MLPPRPFASSTYIIRPEDRIGKDPIMVMKPLKAPGLRLPLVGSHFSSALDAPKDPPMQCKYASIKMPLLLKTMYIESNQEMRQCFITSREPLPFGIFFPSYVVRSVHRGGA